MFLMLPTDIQERFETANLDPDSVSLIVNQKRKVLGLTEALCEISLGKPATIDRISIITNGVIVLKPRLVKFLSIYDST